MKSKMTTSYGGRYPNSDFVLHPDDRKQLRDMKRDKKLARMMNCRKVDKFDKGEHAYQPVAKQKRVSFLKLDTAELYMKAGAQLISDYVSKERIIMDSSGRVLGQIRNDVMLKLFGKYGFKSESIPGTYKTKYSFV